MPGLNGTGPQGQGPMMGRGMGRCNPANAAVTADRGLRMGRGFRFRNQVATPPDFAAQNRLAELESQIAGLQQELTTLRQPHENSDHQR